MSSSLIKQIKTVMFCTRADIIPVTDPNRDSELRRFLTFFNSNSESSCYIVLDPNPDSNLDSELRFFF